MFTIGAREVVIGVIIWHALKKEHKYNSSLSATFSLTFMLSRDTKYEQIITVYLFMLPKLLYLWVSWTKLTRAWLATNSFVWMWCSVRAARLNGICCCRRICIFFVVRLVGRNFLRVQDTYKKKIYSGSPPTNTRMNWRQRAGFYYSISKLYS